MHVCCWATHPYIANSRLFCSQQFRMLNGIPLRFSPYLTLYNCLLAQNCWLRLSDLVKKIRVNKCIIVQYWMPNLVFTLLLLYTLGRTLKEIVCSESSYIEEGSGHYSHFDALRSINRGFEIWRCACGLHQIQSKQVIFLFSLPLCLPLLPGCFRLSFPQ